MALPERRPVIAANGTIVWSFFDAGHSRALSWVARQRMGSRIVVRALTSGP